MSDLMKISNGAMRAIMALNSGGEFSDAEILACLQSAATTVEKAIAADMKTQMRAKLFNMIPGGAK